MRRVVAVALLCTAVAGVGSAAATPPPPRPYEGPGVGTRSDGSVCVYRNTFERDAIVCTPAP